MLAYISTGGLLIPSSPSEVWQIGCSPLVKFRPSIHSHHAPMHPLAISLLRIIYPLSLPDVQRDRPLEVLALGLSRSGTDSLRNALLTLGCTDCYHGFKLSAEDNHTLQWIRLGHSSVHGNTDLLRTEEFDRVLGDCAAVADLPAAGFAKELLVAYPHAKVIVNYRDNVDEWHASFQNTIIKVTTEQGWYEYLLTFFQPALFWRQRAYWWMWRRHCDGDFPRNGRAWYRRHYHDLEQELQTSQRGYLKWQVTDGWEPLCRFLGKEIPDEPFPNGNVPSDFLQRVGANMVAWRRQAERNLALVTGLVVLGVVAFRFR